MTQREIRKKFDEIVAFAEVERFLDTPVKHYSFKVGAPLCRLPNGRARHPTAKCSKNFAAHRGIAAAATTSARVRHSMVMRSRPTNRRSVSLCQGKSPDESRQRHSDGLDAGAISTSRLASGGTRRSLLSTPNRGSSEESRLKSAANRFKKRNTCAHRRQTFSDSLTRSVRTRFSVHKGVGMSLIVQLGRKLRSSTRARLSWASRNLLSFFANWMPGGPLAQYHRQITFQRVYRHQMWGADGSHQFFSGVGSRGRTAEVYVDTMVPIIAAHLSELNSNATIVDLGCGDFWVGACLLERLPSVKYIGCDVVPELVEYNRKTFGSNRIEFRLLDIVSADLPIGDICLVRQVFQHLSNQEISRTLPKLQKYRHVYVTEGHPIVREGKINPDKPTGDDVRFDWTTGHGRGVELDQSPYNLDVDEVCRVATPAPVHEIIVTYRIKM